METLVKSSSYEHPVHSLILEPTDPVWADYFTKEELNEIKKIHQKALPKIPEEFSDYLDKYENDWKSREELYLFADAQVHNPITEFTKKWVRESVVRTSELFLYDNALVLNDYSESDLLHEVWPFVYRIFKEKQIRAALGERASVAVALGRNDDRKLEAIDKRARKNVGAKVDILFKICNDELGSCEVGKDNVTTVDDKYFDDGFIKLPKTLRDMLSVLCEKNPAQINNLFTIGFLMMGKKL